MANKRYQRLKAIMRDNRGKRHEGRFSCYCCHVTYDKGWLYRYEGQDFLFCPMCKEKLKSAKMLHNFVSTSSFESSHSKH